MSISAPAPREWKLAEFLEWESSQSERYELVAGQPIMMAGGSQAHSLIAVNIIALLRPLLRGSPCRLAGSDLRTPIEKTGNSRYGDVVIDCGNFEPKSNEASEPTVIFQILSRSTGWYDQSQKLADYEALETVRHYICLSQDEPRVSIWMRSGMRFEKQPDIVGLGNSFPVFGIDGFLKVSDVYEPVLA